MGVGTAVPMLAGSGAGGRVADGESNANIKAAIAIALTRAAEPATFRSRVGGGPGVANGAANIAFRTVFLDGPGDWRETGPATVCCDLVPVSAARIASALQNRRSGSSDIARSITS